jgi:hypothetical protein
MSTKKRATNHRQLSEIAKNILHDIQDDFKAKGLSASALTEHYIGVAISQLQQKYCESGQTTQVDFDLALKELEDGFLIGTGPMVPYDNEPGNGIFILPSLASASTHISPKMDIGRLAKWAIKKPEIGRPMCTFRTEHFTNPKSGLVSRSPRSKSLMLKMMTR